MIEMKWKKLGNIFNPQKFDDWNYQFGAVPFVGGIDNNFLKVFFTSRNPQKNSLLTYGIFDFSKNFELVSTSQSPLLDLGAPGTFDSAGTMGCQLTEINGQSMLYYQGWNLGVDVPFRNSIGLAFYDAKNDQFSKFSTGPILDRSVHDPCFVASPHIIQIDKNSYLMYYLSCDSWGDDDKGIQHRYNIKIARSSDGINWSRDGTIAIDYENEKEYAFSVPRVLHDSGTYKMWYSYRGSKSSQHYRIGYAESDNGINWQRDDSMVGIDVSEDGWDSEMICYPYVFDHQGERYMLYNGNNYGETGFGIAVLI